LAEFGIVVPEGAHHIDKQFVRLAHPRDTPIPDVARVALNPWPKTSSALEQQINTLDGTINTKVPDNPTARRLRTIPQAELLESKPLKLTAVALAIKLARIAWATLVKIPTDRFRSDGMPEEGVMTRQ
jgi:hypothetical protein